MTVNIPITKQGMLDALLLAWLLFTGAFVYIGVMHLETISKCLVIQTQLMVESSGGQATPPVLILPEPQASPQAPADSELRVRY